MHSHPYPGGGVRRLQSLPTVKPIYFICVAPQAREVFLTGEFNGWDPTSHPMRRQPDGSWQASVFLGHGAHHYQFLVDGRAVNDPRAQGIARNPKGERVSIAMIS